jgi:hypothetical protein
MSKVESNRDHAADRTSWSSSWAPNFNFETPYWLTIQKFIHFQLAVGIFGSLTPHQMTGRQKLYTFIGMYCTISTKCSLFLDFSSTEVADNFSFEL